MLMGYCADEQQPAIVTELMDGGSLYQQLHVQNVPLRMKQKLVRREGLASRA
jgi:hypothetical protein